MRQPLDKIYVTQPFGANPAYYARYGMKGHNGIDYRSRFFDSPLGRRYVVAVEDGVIKDIRWDRTGYGVHIRLVGATGEFVFAHLTKVYVAKGQYVKEGQRIGLTGSTGNSTGPHLHFGWRPVGFNYKNGFLGYEDPARLFVPAPEPTPTKKTTFNMLFFNLPSWQKEKFLEKANAYSQGHPVITAEVRETPIFVSQGMLTYDAQVCLLQNVDTTGFDCVAFCYQGNSTSAYAATSYYPQKNVAIISLPMPTETTVIVHETLHALRKYSNTNKLGPYVEDVEWYPDNLADGANFDNPGWRFQEQFDILKKNY